MHIEYLNMHIFGNYIYTNCLIYIKIIQNNHITSYNICMCNLYT